MADKKGTGKTSPLISVIMSVYKNDENELRRAIESVLNQSVTDFTFYICNDGGGKSISDVVESYDDSRIVLLENESNIGLAASLNRCIEESRGELLIRQDADDYSIQGRFSKTLEYFDLGYDIIGSNILLFDENGVWGKRDYPEYPKKNDFLFAIPFMHGACAISRNAIRRAGLYSTEKVASRCEDYELFMRIYACGGKGVNINERLYAFQESEKTIKRRSYYEKIQQTKVKAKGFSRLGLYPKGILYLPKPLIVGLIPPKLLAGIKNKKFRRKRL